MRRIAADNFGLIIGFLIPGFVALWGFGALSDVVNAWLTTSGGTGPTVGGFLYVTLGSLTAGVTASTIRWALIDTIHHSTGIERPVRDFSRLQANLSAFQGAVENHYRFYQFYGNMMVATAFAFFVHTISGDAVPGWLPTAFGVFEAILWLGSRDALRKYYERTAAILNGGGDWHGETGLTEY